MATERQNMGAQQADGLSQAEPVTRLGPSGFDPSRIGVTSEVLDAVADAIERAECPCREGPYGLYDYSYGNPNPPRSPHVVRDFRDPRDGAYGLPVYRSEDKDNAERVYRGLTRRWIAYEACRAYAIAMEARQGGDGETRLHPKDDSADPEGIAHE